MRRKRMNTKLILLSSVILILVLAMGIMRHDQTSDPGATWWSNGANAVLMVALILGPSLLAHELFKRLIPVERLARDRRRLRRNLREDKQRCAQAQGNIDQRTLHARWWQEQRDMLTAAYTLAFREYGGRVQHEQTTLHAVTNPYERQA